MSLSARHFTNRSVNFTPYRGVLVPLTTRHRPAGPHGEIRLRLACCEPFDGDGLLTFLAARAVRGVEEVVDDTYRRSLPLPHGAGVVALRPAGGHVEATLWLDDERDIDAAVERARHLLDLDADPHAIAEQLRNDPVIGPLVRAAPGRRVPGTAEAAELAVRAVLGQQISLAGAATLAARLVADHGEPLARSVGGVTHVFPTADALAASDPERLAMPRARRAALLGLSAALADGTVRLDDGTDGDEARARLLALPGIGPWTVSYIAMRALRDPDAFLPTDLGVRHALERLGRGGEPAEIARLSESWRPYRAYAVQHLWASLAAR